jgi:hypothetical protein
MQVWEIGSNHLRLQVFMDRMNQWDPGASTKAVIVEEYRDIFERKSLILFLRQAELREESLVATCGSFQVFYRYHWVVVCSSEQSVDFLTAVVISIGS